MINIKAIMSCYKIKLLEDAYQVWLDYSPFLSRPLMNRLDFRDWANRLGFLDLFNHRFKKAFTETYLIQIVEISLKKEPEKRNRTFSFEKKLRQFNRRIEKYLLRK